MKQYLGDKLFLFISTLCIISLGAALISQHIFDMQPCAWCVVQRLLFFFIGIISFFAYFIKNTMISKIVAVIVGILSIMGIIAALLQNALHSENLSCVITPADKIISNTGFDSAMPWLFNIYSSCADDPVILLGIEYFIWSLSLFVVLTIISFSIALRKN
ncbi:disulfide bond formation protein DsbB [Candidatus Kinetoplastibacterium desouzaii TCC079E]|uniref:Disulfide bond formation protein DsbB n=1 Tax=Candidatus Kinetoplastidibacterium desouzai TCC079E TaxID=1208919 RepID=M1LRV0_9PROT|nr:disulfide bond formation protein B [Candidatus Kinetoplastibacterium desouzaii]AGF46871.1 disulfide bond formation protein DsbB [Candidatus Kinetoplastibacterium desouzaii TCC079E]